MEPHLAGWWFQEVHIDTYMGSPPPSMRGAYEENTGYIGYVCVCVCTHTCRQVTLARVCIGASRMILCGYVYWACIGVCMHVGRTGGDCTSVYIGRRMRHLSIQSKQLHMCECLGTCV